MQAYRSNHPNHVHQLTVSVSKHYYITEGGVLKYQKKPIEIRLDNVGASERNHLVHYLIRDHCSGLFYSEVMPSRTLIPVEQFLGRAWRVKNDCVFCGVPSMLTLPRTVELSFPAVRASVTQLGIKIVEVTSGFQGGVRDIRTIEDSLKVVCNRSFDEATSWVNHSVRRHEDSKARTGNETKAALWRRGVASVLAPPDTWGQDA